MNRKSYLSELEIARNNTKTYQNKLKIGPIDIYRDGLSYYDLIDILNQNGFASVHEDIYLCNGEYGKRNIFYHDDNYFAHAYKVTSDESTEERLFATLITPRVQEIDANLNNEFHSLFSKTMQVNRQIVLLNQELNNLQFLKQIRFRKQFREVDLSFLASSQHSLDNRAQAIINQEIIDVLKQNKKLKKIIIP